MTIDRDWLMPGVDVTFKLATFDGRSPKVHDWPGIVRAVYGDAATVSYELPGEECVKVFQRQQLRPAK